MYYEIENIKRFLSIIVHIESIFRNFSIHIYFKFLYSVTVTRLTHASLPTCTKAETINGVPTAIDFKTANGLPKLSFEVKVVRVHTVKTRSKNPLHADVDLVFHTDYVCFSGNSFPQNHMYIAYNSTSLLEFK